MSGLCLKALFLCNEVEETTTSSSATTDSGKMSNGTVQTYHHVTITELYLKEL